LSRQAEAPARPNFAQEDDMAAPTRWTPSYLIHSKLAWISLLMIVGGLLLTFVIQWPMAEPGVGAGHFGPVWLVPVGYFVALIGSGLLAYGWVRWKIRQKQNPTA
jgi:hypothetical protein